MPPTRAMLAEFVGTFALMFVGGAAIIVTGGQDLLVIALAHGLILAVMITATAHVSGGQLNPAVATALAIVGKQPWSQAGLFIIAQLAGAISAALILKGVYAGAADAVNVGATLGSLSMPEVFDPASGAWSVNAGQSVLRTAVLEVIATFFLMFVIMGAAVDTRGVVRTASVGGMAIGLTVAADILAIGPATGASMNPARSFGPALVSGAWDMHLVYWVAPLIGAALAALVWETVFGSAADESA